MSFPRLPRGLAATPLASIEVVSLDLETTGLNPANDRIVEIGALRVGPGDHNDPDLFSLLVNPGVPIPESVSRIHGIRDKDVAGSPTFREALRSFNAWAGVTPFVGYSSDFDVGVFRHEHDRAGLHWSPPRMLDLQILVGLLAPNIDDLKLESVARWLGLGEVLAIAEKGRHRALVDATLTAKIYLALVPFLQGVGIATFAQAEKACSDARHRKGDLKTTQRSRHGGVANLDSFPFRHMVGDVMSRPRVVHSRTSLGVAVDRMTLSSVSSLFIKFADHRRGILTESDVLRAIAQNGVKALSQRVSTHCSEPLVTVDINEFVYRAIVQMTRAGIRHLGVTDANNLLVGALTLRDALSHRGGDAVSLGRNIENAETPAELGKTWADLSAVVGVLAEQSVDARTISAVISRELRSLTQKACQFADAEISQEYGPAPRPYALLVLGSGGRGESLLALDQDNALVIADGNGNDDAWYAELGRKTSMILDQAGVRFCPGDIMASSADWRMSSTAWRETVAGWLSRTKPQDLLNADIFFDARAVHGDRTLAESLMHDTLEMARKSVSFQTLLTVRACEFDSVFGLLGRLRLDRRSRVDLKKSGIMPIFSAARAGAIRLGCDARSTSARLQAIADAHPDKTGVVEDLLAAHTVLLETILDQQLRDLEHGIKLSNSVAPATLSGFDLDQLKWALRKVERVQDLPGAPPLVRAT